MRSALEEVKGVKEVSVSLERKEAVVKYDPDVVKVEDLIKAVKDARGMHSYDAKVKGTLARVTEFRCNANRGGCYAFLQRSHLPPSGKEARRSAADP